MLSTYYSRCSAQCSLLEAQYSPLPKHVYGTEPESHHWAWARSSTLSLQPLWLKIDNWDISNMLDFVATNEIKPDLGRLQIACWACLGNQVSALTALNLQHWEKEYWALSSERRMLSTEHETVIAEHWADIKHRALSNLSWAASLLNAQHGVLSTVHWVVTAQPSVLSTQLWLLLGNEH